MAREADTGREMRERLGYYQRLGCCGNYFAGRRSCSSMTETKCFFWNYWRGADLKGMKLNQQKKIKLGGETPPPNLDACWNFLCNIF